MIRYIHYIICSDAFLFNSIKRTVDFSRRRKMGFTDYIYATIQNLKCSLQVGLNAFFDTHKGGQIACSKQAFSKGRQRIKPEAFRNRIGGALWHPDKSGRTAGPSPCFVRV